MTEEEMAKEYADSVVGCGDGYYEWTDIEQAFLAGLKAQTKWHKVADGDLPNTEIEQNIALKKQIEKMKCCENCKHSDTECEGYTICGIGHYDDCLSNKVLYHTTDEKDYWELQEND